jgi:DNA-binding NarL/FixJ family response regulator
MGSHLLRLSRWLPIWTVWRDLEMSFSLLEITITRTAGAINGAHVTAWSPEDLIEFVRFAAAGHTVLSPVAVRRLIAASADGQQARDRAWQLTAALTAREKEVLACLGTGLSNAQIAARLYLSEATVKGYVSRMLVKLDCASRTQAGLLAHDVGVVFKP